MRYFEHYAIRPLVLGIVIFMFIFAALFKSWNLNCFNGLLMETLWLQPKNATNCKYGQSQTETQLHFIATSLFHAGIVLCVFSEYYALLELTKKISNPKVNKFYFCIFINKFFI